MISQKWQSLSEVSTWTVRTNVHSPHQLITSFPVAKYLMDRTTTIEHLRLTTSHMVTA